MRLINIIAFIFLCTYCTSKNDDDKKDTDAEIQNPVPSNEKKIIIKRELADFDYLVNSDKSINSISRYSALIGSKKVFKTDQFYNTNNWLKNLHIDHGKKNIVVNASNATISFGGGGTNGALKNYISSIYPGVTDWPNLKNSNNKKINNSNRTLEIGNFAISDAPFGKIYHFSGPTKQEDLPKLALGVYKMLIKAESENYEQIILPAISTGIFRLLGGYNAVIDGVKNFIEDYPKFKIIIYLNNFERDKKIIKNQFKDIPNLKDSIHIDEMNFSEKIKNIISETRKEKVFFYMNNLTNPKYVYTSCNGKMFFKEKYEDFKKKIFYIQKDYFCLNELNFENFKLWPYWVNIGEYKAWKDKITKKIKNTNSKLPKEFWFGISDGMGYPVAAFLTKDKGKTFQHISSSFYKYKDKVNSFADKLEAPYDKYLNLWDFI